MHRHFELEHALLANLASLNLAEMQQHAEQRRLARQTAQPEKAHKRFFRMYLVRHYLFRLAPRFAARTFF